jgi:hypothetical protein
VARVADRIEDLPEVGDLATTEECLVLAEAGEELPADDDIPDHRGEFFPAAPEALAGVASKELVGAAQRGKRLGSLDFGGGCGAQRKVVAQALGNGFDSFPTKGSERPKTMRSALRLAGIEAKGASRSPGPPEGAERFWYDLVGVTRAGQDMVPAFGSASDEMLRVRICGSVEPATLMGWVSQATSGRPLMVLQRGVIEPPARRTRATTCRKSSRPVIDAAEMAHLPLRATGVPTP